MRTPGKKIGPKTYVHFSALEESGLPLERLLQASRALPEGWLFQVVRYDASTGDVAFIQSPDFDTADEPLVGDMYVVYGEDLTRSRIPEATFRPYSDRHPQIYHHKWMFVTDDYDGFDVAASKRRSEAIEQLDIDKSRIGWKHIWDEEVAPLLG
jgi:hypothetical protein